MSFENVKNLVFEKKHTVYRNKLNLNFVIGMLLLFSIFFLPNLSILPSLSIRVEDLIFLFILPIFLFRGKIVLNKTVLLIISLIIVELLSILANGNIFYLSAIFEPFKIFKFLVVLYVFYRVFSQYESKFIEYFEIFFTILLIVNLLQYFNVLNFNYYIEKFYASETHLMAFIETPQGSKRLIGLMGNPNNNAILFSFFIAFFISLYISLNQKKYLYSSVIAILMVILCQSRTTFIAVFFALLLLFLFSNNFGRRFAKITKIVLILIILFGFILLGTKLPYIASIRTFFSGENISWQVRVSVWKILWHYVEPNLFLGTGGYKEFYYLRNIDVDSGYMWFVFNFGLISVLIYISIFVNQIYLSLKHRKAVFSYLGFSFSVIVLITSITNAPFQEPRLNLLIAIVMAMFMSSLSKLRNGKPSINKNNNGKNE